MIQTVLILRDKITISYESPNITGTSFKTTTSQEKVILRELSCPF